MIDYYFQTFICGIQTTSNPIHYIILVFNHVFMKKFLLKKVINSHLMSVQTFL